MNVHNSQLREQMLKSLHKLKMSDKDTAFEQFGQARLQCEHKSTTACSLGINKEKSLK